MKFLDALTLARTPRPFDPVRRDYAELAQALQLTVDELHDPRTYGGLKSYRGTVVIPYTRKTYVDALTTAYGLIEHQYAHVVVTGSSGSRTQDHITVWFKSSGKKR